ncbi:MAG: trypsin-like peptidase domain-containing protein [Casimicrobiaceae bacterium]
MKRAPLYSGRKRAPTGAGLDHQHQGESPEPGVAAPPGQGRLRRFVRKNQSLILFVGGMAAAGLGMFAYQSSQPPSREIVQEDIDAAVLNTLENKTLPSKATKAAELVREAVVRVTGYVDESDDSANTPAADSKDQKDSSKPSDPDLARPGEKKGRIATGVVIVESGIILTSLHVVAGAKRISVTFSDGMESEADIVGVQPENDLAVIRAKKVPDDQPAATLGSSMKLKPGDEVVAVGFPFGIGPSVSAGVVSGLNREFRSPEGQRALTKLIQFDAAVNPGNSGGPLVTMDGEVVGIVAALLNPTEARTFLGIGFAVTIESAGSALGIPPF